LTDRLTIILRFFTLTDICWKTIAVLIALVTGLWISATALVTSSLDTVLNAMDVVIAFSAYAVWFRGLRRFRGAIAMTIKTFKPVIRITHFTLV